MADLVVDASITAAWCLPDEATQETATLLRSVGTTLRPVAPAIWPYEIRNTILSALKRGRMTMDDLPAALGLLERLRVQIVEPASQDSVLMLALRHNLTVYDAVYLALAMQTNLPLATLDKALRQAAAAVGVRLLPS